MRQPRLVGCVESGRRNEPPKNLPKTLAQSRKRPQPKALPESGLFLRQEPYYLCQRSPGSGNANALQPVIGHSFVVLDDREYVTANPHVHGGPAWSTIQWAFTSTEAANWHPLTWLSHALDYQIFGLNPAGHHFDSVLIHAVNAVLLFLLLQWATKRVGPSLLVRLCLPCIRST